MTKQELFDAGHHGHSFVDNRCEYCGCPSSCGWGPGADFPLCVDYAKVHGVHVRTDTELRAEYDQQMHADGITHVRGVDSPTSRADICQLCGEPAWEWDEHKTCEESLTRQERSDLSAARVFGDVKESAAHWKKRWGRLKKYQQSGRL